MATYISIATEHLKKNFHVHYPILRLQNTLRVDILTSRLVDQGRTCHSVHGRTRTMPCGTPWIGIMSALHYHVLVNILGSPV